MGRDRGLISSNIIQQEVNVGLACPMWSCTVWPLEMAKMAKHWTNDSNNHLRWTGTEQELNTPFSVKLLLTG